MALLVHNLTLGLDDSEDLLPSLAAKKLRVKVEELKSLCVVRKSLDARVRHLGWTYSVVVELRTGQRGVIQGVRRHDVQMYRPPPRPRVSPGNEGADFPPTIVGAGPAGLFAGLLLAEAGYRPVVLERGWNVDRRGRDVAEFLATRRLDGESNLLFGEGGAGAYSDGKLITRRGDELVDWVIGRLAEFGADEEIVISGRPHVGSDRLPEVVARLRGRIESLGGTVRFGTRVDELEIAESKVRALRLSGGERIGVTCVLLAIGHSARDTYAMLHRRGVKLSARPFQMGVRIEHPQRLIDVAMLGQHADRADLGPADYHLVARGAGGDRDLYSFCMCPGGRVLPACHQEGTLCTNGGSNRNRDSGFANAALVLTLKPREFGDDPFSGLALQESIERACFEAAGGDYSACAQRVDDFVYERPSSGPIETSSLTGARGCDFHALLPRAICQALHAALPQFEQRIAGFAGSQAVLLGPETRASCPVRIDRDADTRASVSADNLYPAGEGAGYAGGIISSAMDGLHSAEAIIARYAPVT